MTRGRGAGERRGRQPGRRFDAAALGAAADLRAAPHGERGGAGRRRLAAAARARSRSRTTACCSSTSCPSSRAPRSRPCASRSRPAASRSRARAAQRVPGALPAGRGDEPLPLRLARRVRRACRCTPEQVARYQGSSSGRCWTASTCTSRCRRWRRPNCSMRPPAKPRARCRRVAAPARASVRARASQPRAAGRGDRPARVLATRRGFPAAGGGAARLERARRTAR